MGIQQEGNAPLCLSAELMCLKIPFHVLRWICKRGRAKKGVTEIPAEQLVDVIAQ